MSGLEPLAALGLACNILQLVELGQKTIKCIEKAYQGQTPHKELKDNATELGRLTNEMRKNKAPEENEYGKILRLSVDRCSAAASKLQNELDLVFGSAKPGSFVAAVKVTFTALRRQHRLDKLKQNLDVEENQMRTRLLVHIW